MKRYFITGTDTDCGKTYVTTQLLNYFPKSKAIKPLACGCFEIDNQLVSLDALQIQKKCNLTLEEINPWRFKSAVSPHIAAKKEGVSVSAKELSDYCLGLKCIDTDLLFIEGAGGVLVPINDEETWIDFLNITEIPVLLVVGMTLGCINHSLLTATALKSANIECVGWIANCLDPKMESLSENIATLSNKLDFPCLAVVSYLGSFNMKVSLL